MFRIGAAPLTGGLFVEGDANAGGRSRALPGGSRWPAGGASGARVKALVLAAGYATRLYPLTLDRPKALLEVGGKPTLDPAAASGADIPIEERDPAEVSSRFAARNPAFDVTPAELVSAIVTEAGVHRPPYASSLPTRVPGAPLRVRGRRAQYG